MALLSAGLLGVRVSWVPAFVLSVCYLAAMGAGGDILSALVNRSHGGLHGPPWGTALLVLAAGLGTICPRGARGTTGGAGEDPRTER